MAIKEDSQGVGLVPAVWLPDTSWPQPPTPAARHQHKLQFSAPQSWRPRKAHPEDARPSSVRPGTEPAEAGARAGTELSTRAPRSGPAGPRPGRGRAFGGRLAPPLLCGSSSQRSAGNSSDHIPELLTDAESTSQEPERLGMFTPRGSACDLTISQSKNCAPAGQRLCDSPPTPTQPGL